MSQADSKVLEAAILALAGNGDLLDRFKADPTTVGAELGLTPKGSAAISRGDRDWLRSAGLNDGLTILVSRWFKDDLGDSANSGRFQVDTESPLPKADVPSRLVFAGGCSHVPDLLARPEIDPADAVERLRNGYRRLGARFRRRRLGPGELGEPAAPGFGRILFGQPLVDLRDAAGAEVPAGLIW